MAMQKNKQDKKVGVRQVLLGSILLNKEVLRWLPIVGLLTFVGLLVISNRFKGEKILREMVVVQEEVKDLRSAYATVDAELTNMTRYSQILHDVTKKGLGLKQPAEPPIKIKVKK